MDSFTALSFYAPLSQFFVPNIPSMFFLAEAPKVPIRPPEMANQCRSYWSHVVNVTHASGLNRLPFKDKAEWTSDARWIIQYRETRPK